MKFRKNGLPFELNDYLDLIDWTSKIISPNKRGYVSEQTPRLLTRIGIHSDKWTQSMQNKQPIFRASGSISKLNRLIKKLNQRTLFGIKYFEYLFD